MATINKSTVDDTPLSDLHTSSPPEPLPSSTGAGTELQAGDTDSHIQLGRFSESSGVDVFVGDLPKDLTEKDLCRIFGEFGTVSELLLKRAKGTKLSLGYAFVKFSVHSEAQAALEELAKPGAINGRDVRVGWAQRNCKIHVGNLASGATVDALNKEFAGSEGLVASETVVHAIGE